MDHCEAAQAAKNEVDISGLRRPRCVAGQFRQRAFAAAMPRSRNAKSRIVFRAGESVTIPKLGRHLQHKRLDIW
jgi:hypothetical protein